MGKKTRYGYQPLAEKYYREMVNVLPPFFKKDFGHILFYNRGTRIYNHRITNMHKCSILADHYQQKVEIPIEVVYPIFSDETESIYESAIGTFQMTKEQKDIYFSKKNEVKTQIDSLFYLQIKAKPFDRFTSKCKMQIVIPIEVVGFTELPLNQK